MLGHWLCFSRKQLTIEDYASQVSWVLISATTRPPSLKPASHGDLCRWSEAFWMSGHMSSAWSMTWLFWTTSQTLSAACMASQAHMALLPCLSAFVKASTSFLPALYPQKTWDLGTRLWPSRYRALLVNHHFVLIRGPFIQFECKI